MSNRKTRAQVNKILHKAFQDIKELKVDFTSLFSISFFDKNRDVTSDSFWFSDSYCEKDDINYLEVFKTQAECLLEEVKELI